MVLPFAMVRLRWQELARRERAELVDIIGVVALDLRRVLAAGATARKTGASVRWLAVD